MFRASPRIKGAIPVSCEEKPCHPEMILKDIGMTGAYVAVADGTAESIWLGETLTLAYELQPRRQQVQLARIVRVEPQGFAVAFLTHDCEISRNLWQFISSRFVKFSNCPFCNKPISKAVKTCSSCGWSLDFRSNTYFEYYTKKFLSTAVKTLIPDLGTPVLSKTFELINRLSAATMTGPVEEPEEEFVGTCPSMREVFSQIRKVAATDISVVILGESGTGKEITAQSIHAKSAHKDGPFVAINCGAIPDSLLESELFGHEKGAFTGAHATTTGKLEYADGGTIFLDEIGEMPLPLQVKLLRFLQDKTVQKIGSVSSKTVDVRVIAATNADLGSQIEQGRFRKDLYYRLEEFVINLPPLRDRGDDRIVLARYFLQKFTYAKNTAKAFSSEAVASILAYDWPGNVRELINKVKRAIVMSSGYIISPADLDLESPKHHKTTDELRRSNAFAQLEKNIILEALDSCGHNISAAAPILGVTRQTLHRRMKKFGLTSVSKL